jgi:hypothetical protein
MKAMIFAVSMMAATAFAGVTYQSIGGVPANNLCDAGNVFKTLKPVVVCDKWKETQGTVHGEIVEPSTWTCVSSSYQQQVISKEKTECLKYSVSEADASCVKWGKTIQGNTVIAEKSTGNGEIGDVQYFNYTIPACK